MEFNPSPSYDLIILGASGFTGKYVVKEALKVLDSPSSTLKTLALAGRNPRKLTQSLQWASHPQSPPSIPILTADISDPQSLRRLCALTKLILNCVGPFHLYGEPVVAACAETGCDYLDICGETEFIERMEAKYHEMAAETGSLIVSACGFDSVPAELGFMFNSRHWAPPSAPNLVEAYLSLESDKKIVGNLGTYESAVLAVANVDQLQKLWRSRPGRAAPSIPGPPLKSPLFEHRKNIGLRAVSLPSADSIIVGKTLSILSENPHGLPGRNESRKYNQTREAVWPTVKAAHFGVKVGYKSLLGLLRFIAFIIFIGLFSRIGLGRRLLLKFPSIFSLGLFKKNGPSDDEVQSASFKMWFIGHGYSDPTQALDESAKPDMEITTRVTGPEIGYITTPIILLQCALVLLGQRDDLPRGGYLTPGIVFGATDLQERLQENGISFDLVSKKMM